MESTYAELDVNSFGRGSELELIDLPGIFATIRDQKRVEVGTTLLLQQIRNIHKIGFSVSYHVVYIENR